MTGTAVQRRRGPQRGEGGGGGGAGSSPGERRQRRGVSALALAATGAGALLLLVCALASGSPAAAAPAAAAAAAAKPMPSLAAVAAAAAAMSSGNPLGPPPVELNPSVMILGMFDWVPYQDQPPFTSRCSDMVDRAKASAGGTRINFVPTHYWQDKDSNGGVDAYCYMDSNMDCVRHTAQSIASFRSGLELCFRRAVEEGLGLSIVPHLDDGGRTAAWRNGLKFNPKQKYGGFSYEDVMLNPIADALAAAIAVTPSWVDPLPVWFALQGEMSATVLNYPGEYWYLLKEIRDRFLSGLRRRGLPETLVAIHSGLTQVGVSFNFNKVLQVNTGGGVGGGSAASVLARFLGFGPFMQGRGLLGLGLGPGAGPDGPELDPALAGPARSLLASPDAAALDLGALRSLFEEIDFLGISAYAALDDPDFPMTALQNAAFTFFGEMRDLVGLDVAPIIRRRGIDLHYSEFGLGGGSSPLGTAAAATPAAAARTPFYGVWGAYVPANDPWAPPAMRAFLHSFFSKTLGWLVQGGGPTYTVSHCFLWGMGSWDVLGIYPESTMPEGTYKDPQVVDSVRRHNAAAAAAVEQRRQAAMQQAQQSAPSPGK
ncbi:hypothetical protein HYH03_008624 [Edaphochlamys debaryana]|uniref:Uncharacterized protein n=1 Tax=Edaphochlamys debaryana TaxID=47281 RepID=A0A835Y8Y5_9CHLO|nr:hypothetical protein HYH03_008624 [Edaphochlamys debaryana]|eukprot:KAG2493204.1 hypothetical protein HYH03_008624 [Edaphochlamys debaryana]